jgi:hypothetical protein
MDSTVVKVQGLKALKELIMEKFDFCKLDLLIFYIIKLILFNIYILATIFNFGIIIDHFLVQ